MTMKPPSPLSTSPFVKSVASGQRRIVIGIACMTMSVAIVWLVVEVATNRVWAQGYSAPSMAGEYDGFTEPQHDIMVAAAEIGRLERIDVKVGDRVEKGQVIGKLEDALQVASVKIAKMQAVMTGELEAAKAEAALNQVRTMKLRQLAGEGMARPDELRRSEADLRISLARQMAAEEQLLLRGLELERYQLQLERRQILSPMAGVISKVFHKPGEYITPGDPAVVRLLVMDRVDAVFNVPVEEISGMAAGDPVRVYLRSSSVTLAAEVTSIAPDIDGESGTVQVRVELDNKDGRLLVGDRCTLQMLRKSRRPKAALLSPRTEEGQRR